MIGVFDELPFINQGEVDVDPGTLIVNYTDGLLDHEYHTNKSWGEETLLEFIQKHGHLPPDQFNQLLMDHIKLVIKGKPIDDVTLLTLRIF
jgi:sigma-B regulation protein RsbU (phosphoserine phosphatase)